MGKCILAGHPPAGGVAQLKLAHGRTKLYNASASVNYAGAGFTAVPSVVCTLEDVTANYAAVLEKVGRTGCVITSSAPSATAAWIAVGV